MILHRADLWPYQNRTIAFQKAVPFSAEWLPMGFGKSVSTLTSFVDMLNTLDAGRMLVVAPKRVARKVWPDEIKRWSHLQGLTVEKIIGTPQQRWDALNRRADIHTINKENLEWLAAQFIEGTGKKLKRLRRLPWDTIVLDESQSFKGAGVRWQVLRELRRLVEVQRMIQLTGTPSPNGYIDLWAQIFLLDFGKRLGVDKEAFIRRWFTVENCDSFSRYKIRDHAAAEIHGLLKDVVLSLRSEDYFGAPPVRYNEIRVELSGSDLTTYKKLEKEYLTEIKGQKITAVNAGVCMGKLLQLANGAIYHDSKGGWTHFHDAKVEALLEVLDASDGPVMIGYGFRHDMARISEALKRFCGKERTWRVLDTEQDEDDWNAGRIDYLVLHPASAGHGLNLQHSGSETIVWFGLTANLEWYQQLNARLIGGHRAHGKNIVIHHIIAERTYDERMIALIGEKAVSQDDLTAALSRLAAQV
jgi:SNF2 family DNA or RNA helicase